MKSVNLLVIDNKINFDAIIFISMDMT